MSHVAHIDLHIKDLDALKVACERIGLELMEGQKTFKWYGKWLDDYHSDKAAVNQGFNPEDFGNCEHTIRLADRRRTQAYEIGLVKRLDGKPGWTLLYDNWGAGKGLEAVCGKGAGLLKQSYAVQIAKRQAKKQGFRVKEVVKADGTVMLSCQK